MGSREGIGDIFGVIFWDLGVFGGHFGVLKYWVELHWRFCRSLGFFGFFECFGVLEGNFWGEKMSFGV